MPCRCCGASRPSKGLNERHERDINTLLRLATKLILEYGNDYPFDGCDEWKKGWLEAFEHHLFGCPEK